MKRTVAAPKEKSPLPARLARFVIAAGIMFMMIAVGATVGQAVGMTYLNQPIDISAENHLIFEVGGNDLVDIQGQSLTSEISSGEEFSLIGPEKTYDSAEFYQPFVVRDGSRYSPVYILTTSLPAGQFKVVSSDYRELDFEIWGNGTITAHLSRSDYKEEFGQNKTLFPSVVGGYLMFVVFCILFYGSISMRRRRLAKAKKQ